MSEILFKPYPWPLKVFGALICLSQFLTLVCLFYSLLPCPEEKPSWLVFVGVPLACAYGKYVSSQFYKPDLYLIIGDRILIYCLLFIFQPELSRFIICCAIFTLERAIVGLYF